MSISLFVTEYLTRSIRSLILISLRSIRSLIFFIIYQKTQILKLIMKSKKQGIFIKSFLLFHSKPQTYFCFRPYCEGFEAEEPHLPTICHLRSLWQRNLHLGTAQDPQVLNWPIRGQILGHVTWSWPITDLDKKKSQTFFKLDSSITYLGISNLKKSLIMKS